MHNGLLHLVAVLTGFHSIIILSFTEYYLSISKEKGLYMEYRICKYYQYLL